MKHFFNLINLFFSGCSACPGLGLRTLPLNHIWKAEIPKAAESLGAQTSVGVLLLGDAERLQKSCGGQNVGGEEKERKTREQGCGGAEDGVCRQLETIP